MANFSDDEKFEIQEILEQRKRKGILEYLVRWKGAGDGSDSWEPAKTIAADCALAVESFIAKSKQASRAKRSTSRSRKVSRSRSRSSSRSRKAQAATKTKASPSRSRSRTRSQKKEEAKSEESSEQAAKKTIIIESASVTSVQTTSKSPVENNSVEKKPQETMATQRVLRSSTMEARKELEVQRVHNDQRPVHKDDNKPRSAIWKVADYAVIVLFVLSLVAALFMFLEKFFDLEDIKKQALPNMTVLKARLATAQNHLVEFAQSGATLVSDSWLYLVEQIKGTGQAAKVAPTPQAQAPGA